MLAIGAAHPVCIVPLQVAPSITATVPGVSVLKAVMIATYAVSVA